MTTLSTPRAHVLSAPPIVSLTQQGRRPKALEGGAATALLHHRQQDPGPVEGFVGKSEDREAAGSGQKAAEACSWQHGQEEVYSSSPSYRVT